MKPTFYEFFAGGGLVRLGLGDNWICTFANDISPEKGAAYRQNFGPGEFRLGDVFDLTPGDLPGPADLWWGSFPCQDLSIAGPGGGLAGQQSGAFWGFWRLAQRMIAAGQPPPVVALENVTGLMTRQGGQDFNTLIDVLAGSGYIVGALEINGAAFVPQSRPRLFVVAVRDHMRLVALAGPGPGRFGHTKRLIGAWSKLPANAKACWAWWQLPEPPPMAQGLADLLDRQPGAWHSASKTQALLTIMSQRHRQQVEAASASQRPTVAAVYRRTRKDGQRAEIRLDGLSGCIRTGSGGSSKQFLLHVEGGAIRSRHFTARELARLMGVSDSYQLPANYSRAYHLLGDGVIVPAVRWLSDNLLLSLVKGKA